MACVKDCEIIKVDYDNGDYNIISDLYELLVDTSEGGCYNISDECNTDIFTIPHTLSGDDCGEVYSQAINLLENVYSKDQVILAYELFGCDYSFYLSDCDDNGACACDNRNYNGRNLMSKRLYGVLTNNGYLDANYSREYLMQLKYNEDDNCIYISDEHSKTNPPTDVTYDTIDDEYKKHLVMTYVGFDRDSGQFLEQIILDEGPDDDGIWKYCLSETDCAHHPANCDVSEGFTNITMVVQYVNGLGLLSQTEIDYPIVNIQPLNIVDGKVKLDGIYKTYYFKILNFPKHTIGTTESTVLTKGSIFYFEYTDSVTNELMEVYAYVNENFSLSWNNGVLTIPASVALYDMNNSNDIRDFIVRYFTIASGIDFLKNLGTFSNVINDVNYTGEDSYVGEDAHLVTYNLRGNIIDSIEDCELHCERFSFDTWMALMQKKMAVGIAFCKGLFKESARIMGTVDERCKNCD